MYFYDFPTLKGSSDKKRETSSSQSSNSSQIPSKKPKPGLTGAASFTALGRPAVKAVDPPSPTSVSSRSEPWEDAAIEVSYYEFPMNFYNHLTILIQFDLCYGSRLRQQIF